jgi:hypothetical protein
VSSASDRDNLVASRAAATTRAAPSRRATGTAVRPALPLPPRTSTLCPAAKPTRRRSATHDDIAGFIAAATATGSAASSSTTLRRGSISVRSAIEPSVVSSRTKQRSPR